MPVYMRAGIADPKSSNTLRFTGGIFAKWESGSAKLNLCENSFCSQSTHNPSNAIELVPTMAYGTWEDASPAMLLHTAISYNFTRVSRSRHFRSNSSLTRSKRLYSHRVIMALPHNHMELRSI